MILKERAKILVKYLLPQRIRLKIQPRNLLAFCIGAPKSGTTSIAGVFESNFRAGHELEREDLIRTIHRHYRREIGDEEYITELKRRDIRVWLEFEATCFLGYRPDLLYRAFPNAKYILTIREPLSWLDSMINHTINYPPRSEDVIALWHGMFFEPQDYPHTEQDKVLKQHGVYSVEAYLRYWARSIQSVLDSIPSEQLLILQTAEVAKRHDKIAAFLGIEEAQLDRQSSHMNQAPAKYHLLDQIAQSYLEQLNVEHCANLYHALSSQG